MAAWTTVVNDAMFLPQLVTLLCAEREAGKVQAGRAREEERGTSKVSKESKEPR